MGVLEEINQKLETILDEVKGANKSDRLLTSAEISEMLRISEKSFPQYVERLIPFGLKKVGGRWKMNEKDLQNFVK